jgi:hypothetical protein
VVEVFYRGYGCWMLIESYPEIDPISQEYVAAGVFTLIDHDATAYKYTKKLDDHIIVLLPSTTHPDSEFLRLVPLNPNFKYTAEECYFRINVEDKNNDRSLLVIDSESTTSDDGGDGDEVADGKKYRGQNRLRTEHAKTYVINNNYKGGDPDKVIFGKLQSEKPDLWPSMTTFRKWIQLEEAKPLFPNNRRNPK